MRRALAFVIAALALAAPPAQAHQVDHVKVTSFDGVQLDGWIVRPADAPADAKLPVVLWSAPYFGQCNFYPAPVNPSDYPSCHYATGDDPALYDGDQVSEAVPVDLLVENGYAVAIFNVRGTGNSGGCFEWIGRREQRDQYELVEWLGTQPWSNGNVGMMGLSYHGTTPWEAAIQNPPHLKTIVPAGIISDAYLFSHTPQGATLAAIGAFDGNFAVRVSLSPPLNGPAEHFTLEHIPVAPGRLCPELVEFLTEDVVGTGTDLRDDAFWKERRLIDRFDRIRASVFIVDGFQDHYLSGHQVQANEVWNRLPHAPKRMVVGQWGHSFPNFNTYNPRWAIADFNAQVLEWLDHWLKEDGRGRAPREGVVDFQEGAYEDQVSPLSSTLDAPPPPWHETSAWPPPESRDEALVLTDGKLGGAARDDAPAASFESFPTVGATGSPKQLLCPETGPRGGLTSTTFWSEPVTNPVRLAGNPVAWLRLTSDLPGGLVGVHLFDVAPDFVCVGEDSLAHGVRYWAAGVADLRFHQGTMTGRDFPVGEATQVRVDITDLAEVLEPGHRLAVVVSRGDPLDRNGQAFYPNIGVETGGGARLASQVILPVWCGSLGGSTPRADLPPRPFLPAAAARKSSSSKRFNGRKRRRRERACQ